MWQFDEQTGRWRQLRIQGWVNEPWLRVSILDSVGAILQGYIYIYRGNVKLDIYTHAVIQGFYRGI